MPASAASWRDRRRGACAYTASPHPPASPPTAQLVAPTRGDTPERRSAPPARAPVPRQASQPDGGGKRPDARIGPPGVPTLRPRARPDRAAHDAVGYPVTLGERPARQGVERCASGVPREVKNREYRVALTPAGVTELVRAGHEVLVERGAGEGSSIPDADFVAAGRPDRRRRRRRVGRRGPAAQGQGADRRGVPPAAGRPDAVHLPAPRRVEGVHRRAGRLGHDRDRLRDRADRRRRAAAAGADVGGRRPDGPPGRGAQPGARPRRPRGAARRGLRASTRRRSSSSVPASPA